MPTPAQDQQKARQGGVGDQGKAPAPHPPLKRSDAKVQRNHAQVKTLLRQDAQRDLRVDTPEERASWLQTKKDEVLSALVDAATKKLTDNLSAKMTKVVTAQKKQILESARVAVQASIDQSNHAGEKSDLKADTLVSESEAWSEAAGVATEEAGKLVRQQGGALKAAADPAFIVGNDVSLKLTDRQKHLEKVAVAAKNLIDAKAKQIELTLAADAEKQTTKDRVVNAAKTKASSAASADVAGEVDTRHANDAKVEDAVKAPVKKTADEIRAETRTYLEKGVGANGTGWFRSTQFKNFHAKMKSEARAKGHQMTDDAITEKRGQGGGAPGHKAEFEYQTAQAQLLTHEAAKLELREIMKGFAGDLLDQTSAAVNVEQPLHASGTAAAWAVLRNDPAATKNETAAGKAAASAVKAAKPEVLDKFHKKAQALKNSYIKVTDDDPQVQEQEQAKKNKEVVDQKVKPQFDTREKDGEKFGQRMLRQAMEAPTAGKGLQLIAGLIDATTPQRGDETELEVTLKIPATHGAFCYFTVKGSAARSEHMELGIEIGFGAGWETWGLSAKGGFVVFLKAGAHDTVSAMQLIHYGAFRNLCHVSNSAANFWAGATDSKKTAGETGKEIGKTEQAELWAAMTEERIFGQDKKAFVEVGGGIKGGAHLNAGVEGEVTGGLTTALRWDKEVFDKVSEEDAEYGAGKMGDRAGAGDRDARKALAKRKRALVNQHDKRVNRFKFGASLGAEVNGQKFQVGVEGTKSFAPQGKWEFEAAAEVPYDPHESGSNTLFSKIAASYFPAAMGGIKKIHDAYKAKHPDHVPPGHVSEEDTGSGAGRVAGGLADTGEDILVAVDAAGGSKDLLAKLAEANPQNLPGGKAIGTNDTARLWLGKSMKMDKMMGDKGDMNEATSEAEDAQPFGGSSSLEIAMSVEREYTPYQPAANGQPAVLPKPKPIKVTFKVSKSKELKMGGNLGGGVGLNAKLTRKQELGGVALGGGEGVQPFMGGRG